MHIKVVVYDNPILCSRVQQMAHRSSWDDSLLPTSPVGMTRLRSRFDMGEVGPILDGTRKEIYGILLQDIPHRLNNGIMLTKHPTKHTHPPDKNEGPRINLPGLDAKTYSRGSV